MRICFIGHSYHRSTRSHLFFLDILQCLGQVDVFFDESWCLKRAPWIDAFDPQSYDCVVIWQVQEALQYVRGAHSNVVFVPMYDAFGGERFVWNDALEPIKILCFSSTLYDQLSPYSSRSIYLQYFPDPSDYPSISRKTSLRAFFWQRVPSVNPKLISQLCGDIVLDRFTMHFAPDPLSGPRQGVDRAVKAHEERISVWQPEGATHLSSLAEHNIFFAPRPSEGIGMSFLEAMAMGLCVVAPNTPTHNEYITDGVTGLLYDPERPMALSFSNVRQIGENARESIRMGFARWTAARQDLIRFVSQPVAIQAAPDE